MAKLEIKIPDIGDYQGVPVIEVLIKDGDTVKAEQPLLVLETDKATMEIPSPGAGVVQGLKLKAGDKVSKGDAVCSLQGTAAATPLPRGEGPGVRASEDQASSMTQTPSPAPAGHPLPAGEGRAAAASTLAVTIPDIGDFSGVPVIEVLVKDGDTVEAEQPLLVLETDKATMEIPSPGAGVVQGLKLKAGDKVSKGDEVCSLQGAAASTPLPPGEGPGVRASEAQASSVTQTPSPAPAGHPLPAGEGKASAQPVAETPQQSSGKPGQLPYAGPATRKFARELGVDLSLVKGSGLRGRIVIEDVQGYVKQTLAQPAAAATSAAPAGGSGIPPIPAVDFSQFGEIETVPLARIRKLSAAHLHRAWVNIPHVTQTDDADITDLEAFRKSASDESGTKLTLLPFVMKAVEKAMQAYPDFNSSLSPDGASLIRKKYLHIGFAADTPNGLVVPVVRDVDQKGIVQLANECAELAKKARDGKLKPDEMKGGCFSISSLGGIGGGYFTPIVNAPEVAILGVSRGVMKPVWDGKAFQPRLMLPLSLSYDHRVIDGALGARFIVMLTKLLGDLRRLTL